MLKSCPQCGIGWEEKETITEHFHNSYTKDGIPEYILKETPLISVEDAAIKTASNYGCKPDNPKHFSINMYGLETEDYDGVSYWVCTSCHAHTQIGLLVQ
jgi:hypothetical protein